MGLLAPLDWASVAISSDEPGEAWQKLFDELSEHGFENCSASHMQISNHVLPEESHGVLVSRSFEDFVSDQPEITLAIDTIGRFARSEQVLAATSLHPDYAKWSPSDQEFLSFMTEFGYRGGIAASVRDPLRGQFTLLTASCLTSESDALEGIGQVASSLLPAITFLQEGIKLKELVASAEFQPLSPREQECLTWVCSGHMNGAIAKRTGLSEATVQEYIRNACRKLQARTRAQAAARATLLHMIEP